jgi:hypothetical protein
MNMKLVTLGLLAASMVLSFSSPSFARSIDRTPVVATLTGYLANIQGAYLLADGRLQIQDTAGKVKTVQLTTEATAKLSELAQDLVGAKLNDSTTMVICRMMAKPSLSVLSVGAPLAIVLTNQDCTVSHKVSPKDKELLARARELRMSMTTLALNAL